MRFTNYTFKSIPQSKYVNFDFENIELSNTTGVASLAFSGTGSNVGFNLISGKVYDLNNKYIYSYQAGQPFSLSGYIETGKAIVYLNNSRLKTNSLSANEYNAFYVNVSGVELTSDVFLKMPKITYSFPSQFYYKPNSTFNLSLTNSSNLDFKIYNSTILYVNQQINYSGELSGQITGTVLRNSTANFSLTDTSNLLNDKAYEVQMFFDTNFGQFSQIFTGNRVSGFINLYAFDIQLNPFDPTPIQASYNGTSSLNSFSFAHGTDFRYLSVNVSKYNLSNQQYETGAYYFTFEPVNPLDSDSYPNYYPQSITITNTGLYDTCPTAAFTEYYYVDSLSINSSYILVSTGCTGNIPLIFSTSGTVGTGASGYLLINPANNVVIGYATGHSATGYSITAPGSGYTGIINVRLNTGIYPNCYDVPVVKSTNGIYPFYPFSGSVNVGRNAGYMTGLVICSSNLTGSDSTFNYYSNSVSGIWITNPGSGYSNIFKPYIRFIRNSSDTQTSNASAIINLNTGSGTYDFYSNWSLTTGSVSYKLQSIPQFADDKLILIEDFSAYFITEDSGYAITNEIKTYSGYAIYPAINNNLFFRVDYNGSNYLNPVVKFKLWNERQYFIESYLTGNTNYSTDPYLINSTNAPQNLPNKVYKNLLLI